MMRLKKGFNKANKKQLRKLNIQIIGFHNTQERDWAEQMKIAQERIKNLKQRIIYQNEKYDELEKESEIRTSYTSDLLDNAYS